MKSQPLVSVIIPTYKQPEKLINAINSVLNQSYKNYELIIVDDNNPSTLERNLTEKAMFAYIDNPRVKYIQHEKNKNGSAARNTGFKNSNGEYIMFLDDDDEFYCKKIEMQVSLLEQLDNSWGVCYTNYVRKKKGRIYFRNGENREGDMFLEELKRNFFIHAGSNLMVRRQVVIDVGGFDESFERNQDIEFLVKILGKYKIAYVNYLGLIVNVNDKKKDVDFEKLTFHYISTFKKYIDNLSTDDRKDFYRMINLQLFRYYLIQKKDFKKCVSMIRSRKVFLKECFKYLFYLLGRKITRKSVGFKYKTR